MPRSSLRRGARVAFLLSLSLGTVFCRIGAPRLAPPPPEIHSIEGYGSASAQGGEAALKGRFAFHFHVSGLGRVEALDAIGRTSFVLLFHEDRAYFILPSRRAYAEDTPAGVMERFLGLRLLPREALYLMSGRWDGDADETGAWILRKDENGRILEGAKADMVFLVREFFSKTGVPRTVEFFGAEVSGSFRILDVRFNSGASERAADARFLKRFTLTDWEDMEAWIRDDR